MEFRFNVTQLLRSPIVRINNNLLPNGFIGDRRNASETATRISEIINEVGEASARAQGLSKPVTTAHKLRNSDHIVYIISENSGRNGVVTGLLKIGIKSLYVFDANGDTQMVNAPCVLDFYIHESRQRAGLGKILFQSMLQQENYKPEKLAIDRPSEKLVGFLRKHYGLKDTIPQMNNFVVYHGFFENGNKPENHTETDRRLHLTSSPNTSLFGPQFLNDEYKRRSKTQDNSPNFGQSSPIGRYAAHKHHDHMAQIIHNSPNTHQLPSEPQSYNDNSISYANLDYLIDNRNNAMNGERDIVELKLPDDHVEAIVMQHTDPIKDVVDHHHVKKVTISENHSSHHHNPAPDDGPSIRPNYFYHTKQHTGMKNISDNVGMAVSPTNKMEFYQEVPESFGLVKITQPIGQQQHLGVDMKDDASQTATGQEKNCLTDQGFFDLKFYHNKLW